MGAGKYTSENRLAETLGLLEAARAKHEHVIVGFSGGKDSLACMDLCYRVFPKVSAFFMYLVPGLEIDRRLPDLLASRWPKATLKTYPHWIVGGFLRDGVYCFPVDLPRRPTGKELYMKAAVDVGATVIATGMKRADSLHRRRAMGSGAADHLLMPLVGWNKFDVVGYLKTRNIPLPDSEGCTANGLDLTAPPLRWLATKHPKDFERLCKVFPFAPAALWREHFFEGAPRPDGKVLVDGVLL